MNLLTMYKCLTKSTDEIKTLITDFKKSNKNILTNYIPDPKLFSKWNNKDRTKVFLFDSGIFIVYENSLMAETIFMISTNKNFKAYLNIIREKLGCPVVVERVYRENKDVLIDSPNSILRRMSRTGIFDEELISSEIVKKANIEDLPSIERIFNNNFNPFTERIPDKAELKALIDHEGISVIKENEEIIGMIIYEKAPASIHLRYWWMSSQHRNKGYGSKLLKDYFKAGKECKRQFLWVFSDNSDAIAKYHHYGFKFDGIADEIYVIK